jgi:membrane-bound metal-dependent hydrolase YbcI (DUF457 family)
VVRDPDGVLKTFKAGGVSDVAADGEAVMPGTSKIVLVRDPNNLILELIQRPKRAGGKVFVGHFAVAFAAKPLAPKVSLPALILAAALSDALWILFFVLGIEQVVIRPGLMAANSLDLVYIPFSHSLLMDAFWGGLFGGLYFMKRRDSRGAWILFAAVLSHWLLDFATHRPDMPLAPGIGMRFGLGLWNSRAATFIVEGALWFGAVILYARATRPNNRAGVYAFWTMIVLLTALWVISLGGAPPPSLSSLAIVNTIFFAVVLSWAYWMNRSRDVLEGVSA